MAMGYKVFTSPHIVVAGMVVSAPIADNAQTAALRTVARGAGALL